MIERTVGASTLAPPHLITASIWASPTFLSRHPSLAVCRRWPLYAPPSSIICCFALVAHIAFGLLDMHIHPRPHSSRSFSVSLARVSQVFSCSCAAFIPTTNRMTSTQATSLTEAAAERLVRVFPHEISRTSQNSSIMSSSTLSTVAERPAPVPPVFLSSSLSFLSFFK